MQEGPGGAAEGGDVRGAVGGRGGWWVGGGGWGSGRVGGGGVFFGHGGPGGEGGAGAAAGVVVSSVEVISLMGLLFAGSGWTHGLPSLPSTTPLGMAFFSGAVGSSGSAVGFWFVFCISLKNLSMARIGVQRRERERARI